MATFYNRAILNLGSNSLSSNVTVGEIESALSMTKTAASANYGKGDGITYIVSITNSTPSSVSDVSMTDNLGAYADPVSGLTVTPLSYVTGSLIYYVNGVLTTPPTVTAGDTLTVSGITVPAGGSVTLVYEAVANGFAPLSAGSEITNTVTIDSPEPLTDSATVPVREEPELTIAKALCPTVISDGGELTYTFVIQNTGNVPVDATDGLFITDVFNPKLNGITVTVDGTPIAEGTGYTYNELTGEFATLSGALSVPAATYVTDPTTGALTVNPGVTVITVNGTV